MKLSSEMSWLPRGSSEQGNSGRADTKPVKMISGAASLSCDYDYDRRTDVRITSNDETILRTLIEQCVPTNMIHVYYQGELASDFSALVESLARVAATHSVLVKILEIDSPGGDVDAAMKAGDAIANGGWGIWVNEGASCMSACVLLLAAGSMRSLSGKVGVHRLFPVTSKANTRADLDAELEAIGVRAKAYLRVNGVTPHSRT
jgi:hypothetical protein